MLVFSHSFLKSRLSLIRKIISFLGKRLHVCVCVLGGEGGEGGGVWGGGGGGGGGGG